jgi:hypothetical protein
LYAYAVTFFFSEQIPVLKMQLFWCVKTQKYFLIKFGAVNGLFWCGQDIFGASKA